MKIRKIMTRNVEVITTDTTLVKAANRMKALDVGLLPVCDGQTLKGMFTDRDITVRAIADGRDPRITTARDVMTPEVVYCLEGQDVREVVRMMEERQIRGMPILDASMHLVEIVSLGDIAVRTGDEAMAGEALEEVSEPAQPQT